MGSGSRHWRANFGGLLGEGNEMHHMMTTSGKGSFNAIRSLCLLNQNPGILIILYADRSRRMHQRNGAVGSMGLEVGVQYLTTKPRHKWVSCWRRRTRVWNVARQRETGGKHNIHRPGTTNRCTISLSCITEILPLREYSLIMIMMCLATIH